MTHASEWNALELRRENTLYRKQIDAMAFRLVEMTDARNRAREALDRLGLHAWSAGKPATFTEEQLSVYREALRETEAKP